MLKLYTLLTNYCDIHSKKRTENIILTLAEIQAFDDVKQKFSRVSILIHLIPDAEISLAIDASEISVVGAILQQLQHS